MTVAVDASSILGNESGLEFDDMIDWLENNVGPMVKDDVGLKDRTQHFNIQGTGWRYECLIRQVAPDHPSLATLDDPMWVRHDFQSTVLLMKRIVTFDDDDQALIFKLSL